MQGNVLFQENGGYNPTNQTDDLQFYQTTYSSQQGQTGGGQYPYTAGSSTAPIGGGSVDYSPPGIVTWESIRTAFGTGGYPGEAPLLEELGINFEHIRTKSITVLNPLRPMDKHIMDDTDLAGPLIFVFLCGGFLLLSGKIQFGYIYGVAMLGCVSIYMILNLMSEMGIDGYRTASVLGYCLLPMVLLSSVSVLLRLGGLIGLILAMISVVWCTYSASLMFVTVLSMTEQRMLVAYPIFLVYAIFGLLIIL
ncbi:hypothetical protein SmJEL517_g03275 [Synchytrium microbalum]|uniref:Protein YIP n=1 Tax=Synchytrium microbalum TaxID=1806994 RepID=A0A507C3W3_9FUNG|nr:uncharacterized protein SmJEL517_g03275 [Synchytrium microbalum]TPX34078.1 hypothetical protein SmJEL517_g03275 [Synchytrium microbalum]